MKVLHESIFLVFVYKIQLSNSGYRTYIIKNFSHLNP